MVHAGKLISLFCLGMLFLLPGQSRAQTSSPANSADLQKVITQLNAAASKFSSAQADFTWDQYQAVVEEHDVQTGTIYYERKKGVTRTAAYIKEDNGKPAPKTVVYDNGEAQYYVPSIKQLTVIRAGANKGQWESFLTLGFGGSGKDMLKSFDVSYLGSEKVGGVDAVKLGLVPKSVKVRNNFDHILLWIDPALGVSVQQQLFSSGDYRLAKYSDIQLHQKIPDSVFKLKTTGKTKLLSPQG